MADFATSDIYKEFINLISFYNKRDEDDEDKDFSKYEDAIIKIVELKNLLECIDYDYKNYEFIVHFNNGYNQEYFCYQLNEIAEHLDEYNSYNIVFPPQNSQKYDYKYAYITGLSSDGNIETIEYNFGDINKIKEKYPDYDFRRTWPSNDIKIALKD